MIDLSQAVVVVDANQPQYVQHAVDDLRAYLREVAGDSTSADQTIITIGAKSSAGISSNPPPDLGDEGFVIRSKAKKGNDRIAIMGGGPKGIKHGIYELMRILTFSRNRAYVKGPIDITARPSFPLRGMHLNGWPVGYPYAFRKWHEEDWKRYIDILSCQHANVVFIWPFMEIIPLPLSKEDEAYLQEFRRVVDYAQREHGMEVWMMQSANKVASNNLGVTDPRERPYWKHDVQAIQNPADPAAFEKIMAAKQALYKIVNNVDGVVTIDSDPGGWQDSPISEYVKLFRGYRGLLDKHNIHGKQTKLIDWLWLGWGYQDLPAYDVEHHRKTLRAFKKDVPEPWWVIAGYEAPLPMLKEEGLLEKTVFLRYGGIEDEPAYPKTWVNCDKPKAVMANLVDYPQVVGVMGNSQIPLIQLPRTYALLRSAWDFSYRNRTQADILQDLARELYPDNAGLIADCYEALDSPDEHLPGTLKKLEAVMTSGKLGKPGLIARKLFPTTDFAAADLLAQLRFETAQYRLTSGITARSSADDDKELIAGLIDAYLAWEDRHHWHEYWEKTYGWGQGWPLGCFAQSGEFARVAGVLRHKLPDEHGLAAFLSDTAKRLDGKYLDRNVQDWGITPFKTALEGIVMTVANSATATASAVPKPGEYPPSKAIDGSLSTLYWPGALVGNNAEWLQLTWEKPQAIRKVVVHFLKHPSMAGRTIRLQEQRTDGAWQDIATTVVTDDPNAKQCVVAFDLPAITFLDKIRIVNLLDLYEVAVY